MERERLMEVQRETDVLLRPLHTNPFLGVRGRRRQAGIRGAPTQVGVYRTVVALRHILSPPAAARRHPLLIQHVESVATPADRVGRIKQSDWLVQHFATSRRAGK